MPDKNDLAPVVAVLNMKGGVGKTTIATNVFRVLYHELHAKTLLIDLDPQFNATQAVMDRATYEEHRDADTTVFAVMEPSSSVGLFDVALSTGEPPDPDDVSIGLRHFVNKPDVNLRIVPGDWRLVKYSLISDKDKLDRVQERFAKFIAKTRRSNSVVCIDCNPSSSFITSCALHAATHILVPVRPDRYSILGLEILADLVDNIPTIHPKPTFIILLNGTPRGDTDEGTAAIQSELRAHTRFGPLVLANQLPYSGLLSAKPNYTGFATDKPVAWSDTLKGEIRAIVNEISQKIGVAKP